MLIILSIFVENDFNQNNNINFYYTLTINIIIVYVHVLHVIFASEDSLKFKNFFFLMDACNYLHTIYNLNIV